MCFGKQALQARVLILKLLQPLGFRHLNAAELCLPLVYAGVFMLSLFAGIGFRIEPLRRFAPEIAPANSQRSETMSDIVFLVLGLGLIGVMALYAHALTRA